MHSKVNLTLLIIAGILVACHGYSFRLSGCPKVKVMKDFDMDQFLGEWYVVGRFNPLATCAKFQIEKSPEGVYAVNETSHFLGLGYGFHGLTRRGRQLKILRDDTDAIFKVQQFFDPFSLKTYGVVDTDYTSYAVLWGCDPLLVGSVQNLDILSRDPDANDDLLKHAEKLAEKSNVDIHPIERLYHKRCSHMDDLFQTGTVVGINNMYTEKKKKK